MVFGSHHVFCFPLLLSSLNRSTKTTTNHILYLPLFLVGVLNSIDDLDRKSGGPGEEDERT
jgi:hypothetical protein